MKFLCFLCIKFLSALNQPRKYQHIFFDLDHTLWDFDANALETLQDVYHQLNLPEKGINDFKTFSAHYIHYNHLLWDRYHKGFISAEDLKWKRMWRTLLEFKIGDEALAKCMSDLFLDILPGKKNLFPHTREILSYLKEKNYTLHLITNGFEKTQHKKLQTSSLSHFFTHVITSETGNSIKPHKAIFDFALQKSGASVNESIMIGDNPEADIKGGINAGMDTVFVNHIRQTIALTPTYTIYHLSELENIL